MCGWVGLAKLITDLDMRKGYMGGVRVGFVNINVVYDYEVKQRVALVRVPFSLHKFLADFVIIHIYTTCMYACMCIRI
jgi:hypothetical protein